jgi:hypothetical protein
MPRGPFSGSPADVPPVKRSNLLAPSPTARPGNIVGDALDPHAPPIDTAPVISGYDFLEGEIAELPTRTTKQVDAAAGVLAVVQ